MCTKLGKCKHYSHTHTVHGFRKIFRITIKSHQQGSYVGSPEDVFTIIGALRAVAGSGLAVGQNVDQGK